MKKKQSEPSVENMELVDFLDLSPDEQVARRFGEDVYFNMIQECSIETKQFLLEGDPQSIIVPFTLRLAEIFGSGNVQASLETLAYIKVNPYHAHLMRDRSRCAIFMLDLYFFLKDSVNSDTTRLMVLLKAFEAYDVPYYCEALKHYMKIPDYDKFIGNSFKNAMKLSILEESPMVDAYIEKKFNVQLCGDLCIVVNDFVLEDSDIKFYFQHEYDTNVYVGGHYQSSLNKYSILDFDKYSKLDGGDYMWRICMTFMSNKSLLRIALTCMGNYISAMKEFSDRSLRSTWRPDTLGDKPWYDYRARCLFHFDHEHCSNSSKLEAEEPDLLFNLADEVHSDYFPNFIDNLMWVDENLVYSFSRFPRVSLAIIMIFIYKRYGAQCVKKFFRLKDEYGVCDVYVANALRYLMEQAQRDIFCTFLSWKMPYVSSIYEWDGHPASVIMRHQEDSLKGNDYIDKEMLDDYLEEETLKQLYAEKNKVCLCCESYCPVPNYYYFEEVISEEWSSPNFVQDCLVSKVSAKIIEEEK